MNNRKKELETILCPVAHVPTEQEHKIAYLTYVLDSVFYDYLLCINRVRTGKTKDDLRKNIDGTESLVERTLKSIDEIFEKHQDNKKVWESWCDYEDFKKTWGMECLSSMHCGDCIAFPASCDRCTAELIYGIPCSATWKDKQEGWNLYSEYVSLLKKDE